MASTPRVLGRHARLITLAAAALALVVPTSAQALTLTSKNKKVNHKFKFSFGAYDSQGQGGDSAYSGLLKGSENDSYSFFKGMKVNAKSNMSSATVKGKLRGKHGSVNMKFHATGKKHSVKVPKHCTGTPGEARSGVVTGHFTLHAGHLGTVHVTKIKATLGNPPQITNCTGGGGGFTDGTNLSGGKSTKHSSWNASAFKPKKKSQKVSESLSVYRSGSGWSESHFVSATVARSKYTFNSSLKKGTIKGGGKISGKASYSGSTISSTYTSGKMKGTLKAHFATIGTFKAFKKGKVDASQSSF